MMITTLLIIHGLIAVALLGGITHQTAAACWPAAKGGGSFLTSFRAVAGARFTTVNTALYVAAVVLGSVIYPAYRLAVRPYLESARLTTINGTFELKEQFVTIGLGILPLYWLVWRTPLDAKLSGARAAITALLCFIVWYSFLVGHVLNNVRGMFGR